MRGLDSPFPAGGLCAVELPISDIMSTNEEAVALWLPSGCGHGASPR